MLNIKTEKSLHCPLSVIVSFTVVFGIVWHLAGCSPSGNASRSIILISIDTCRADYFGCYGYPGTTTPNIDSIAAQGVLFENVFTTVPLTLPAHSSMLTGTIPPYHGVRVNSGSRLAEANETLAEILRDNGFQTCGVPGATIMASQFGIAQGFETFDDDFSAQRDRSIRYERRAEEVWARANRWLDGRAGGDFFLFLHFYDPHFPYLPPEPFAQKHARDLYAGEIAYTDHCIGQVFESLKNRGIFDSSLIIITSDHGESFGEHGEKQHGFLTYNSTLKVPLILKLPGEHTARRIGQVVGLIDIVPTVLAVFDIPSSSKIHGRNLLGHLENDPSSLKRRSFYFESLYPSILGFSSLHGIVNDEWKYIHTLRPELYALGDDPDETSNSLLAQDEIAELMQKRLNTLLKTTAQIEADEESSSAAENYSILSGLGYLGAGIGEIDTMIEGRGDPKDYVEVANDVIEMTILRENGEDDEAIALCNQIIARSPELGIVHSSLGSLLEKRGDLEGAILHFREAVTFKYGNQFDNSMHHFVLAGALARKGDMLEAKRHYLKSLVLNPKNARAHCHLAATLEALGDSDNAERHLIEASELDPGDGETRFRLAIIFEARGNLQAAIEQFEESVRLAPDRPEPYNKLARILATHEKYRNTRKAIEYAQEACALTDYRNPFFLTTLGLAYAAAGERAKSNETRQKAVDIAQEMGIPIRGSGKRAAPKQP